MLAPPKEHVCPFAVIFNLQLKATLTEGWAGQWVRCPAGLAATPLHLPALLFWPESEPALQGLWPASWGLKASICPAGDAERPQRPAVQPGPGSIKWAVFVEMLHTNCTQAVHKHFCTGRLRLSGYTRSWVHSLMGKLMPQRDHELTSEPGHLSWLEAGQTFRQEDSLRLGPFWLL